MARLSHFAYYLGNSKTSWDKPRNTIFDQCVKGDSIQGMSDNLLTQCSNDSVTKCAKGDSD